MSPPLSAIPSSPSRKTSIRGDRAAAADSNSAPVAARGSTVPHPGASGLAARTARAEALPFPFVDDTKYAVAQAGPAPGPGPAPAPGPGPAPAPAGPSASLALRGLSYHDSVVAGSHKNISFNVTWKGGVKEDYIVVNWLKGSMKDPAGTPFKVFMYGSLVDFDFPTWQVDSVDADPAYWSAGGVRWNYAVDGAHKFHATDDPHPPSWATGVKARIQFKTAVYKSADVPAKTAGSIAAVPLSEFRFWSYHVHVLAPGKFDHT